MLRAADELLQLGVEGLVEVLVLLAEGDGAVADDRFAGDLAERLGRFHAFVLGGHVGDRERGQRGGVGAAGLHGGNQARLVGQLHDLLFLHAGIARIAGLDRARHHGELQLRIGGDRAVVGEALGVARGDQEGLADAVGRLGELHLLAALRVDEHAGGDDVEAAGLQAGDQRAELGQHAVDLVDAHLGEHRLDDLGRLAGELAVRRGEAVRRLVGEADADVAVGLGFLERRLGFGGKCGGERRGAGDHREKRAPGQA